MLGLKKNKTEEAQQSQNSSQGKKSIYEAIISIDKIFLVTLIFLIAVGTVMIFSASSTYAETYLGDSYHFIKKHLENLVVGAVAMCIMTFVDYRLLNNFAVHIFLGSYALMWLVTISGLGTTGKGAERWINIGFSFQPSELFKLAIIIFFSHYIAKNYDKINNGTKKEQINYGLWFYLMMAVIIIVPFLFQKHVSGTVICIVILGCMMMIGGTKIKLIIWLFCSVAVGIVCLAWFVFDHAKSRLGAWFNPFAPELIRNEGWQPVQSQLAVASGEFWGVGFGASRQKQLYLPEPQNDYIFAILCEEMGFIGALAIICVFMFLIYRGIMIAIRSPEKFSAMLGVGIMFQIGAQTVANILVVTGWFPSTGISLPFFSYGGSSLIFLMAEMGIMLNISRHTLLQVQ